MTTLLNPITKKEHNKGQRILVGIGHGIVFGTLALFVGVTMPFRMNEGKSKWQKGLEKAKKHDDELRKLSDLESGYY